MTAEVYECLWKRNIHEDGMDMAQTYHSIFDRAKVLIKEDDCMKFYVEMSPLYVELNESKIGP